MPFVNKVKPSETVESVVYKIGDKVSSNLEKDLQSIGLQSFPQKITILAFKEEQVLQVYAHVQESKLLLKEFPFTATSGQLGPKLKEGDKQIPEGVYAIEYLNPNSHYYLSMKVDYPNAFDKSKTIYEDYSEMGGDIFIHGKSATVGCIPIGDKAIEELFVLVQAALPQGVEVIISPRDFRNNDEWPVIDFIDWEEELYAIIEDRLKAF